MLQQAERKTLASTLSRLAKPALLSAVLGLCVAAAAADAPETVIGELNAYAVTYDEVGEETLEAAERITPGGTIEYRLTYMNNTDAPLTGFTINGPVPNSAHYLSNSQEVVSAAIFQARTTDIDWQTPPLIRIVEDEAGILRPETVPPADYAEIRWQLTDPVEAGAEIEARYRVRITR